MTTPYWSDFIPNSTFYRILRGFLRVFATGVACQQGMLTPPDTWSRPFATCICSTCWDQSFFRTCYFYGLCSSLGTFSILFWKNVNTFTLSIRLPLIKHWERDVNTVQCKTQLLTWQLTDFWNANLNMKMILIRNFITNINILIKVFFYCYIKFHWSSFNLSLGAFRAL